MTSTTKSHVYRRKLSGEDVETGSVLIEKSRWPMFPPPMHDFGVQVGGARFATRIVADDCACLPPAHQHYHLEVEHFRDRFAFSTGGTIQILLADGEYVNRDG